jgi:DNA replication protein DnaC
MELVKPQQSERLTSIDSTARRLINQMIENAPVDVDLKFNCVQCEDSSSGFDIRHYRETGKLQRCECAKDRVKKERFFKAVEATPRKFGWITDGLNSVPLMPKIHPRQPIVLEKLRQNSDRSYFFFGKTGTHKTTLALALMQEAGRRGMKTSYEVGRSLVDNIRNFQNKGIRPKNKEIYTLEQFETDEKFCLLIDEIEDTASSLTPYTLSVLFAVAEKCQAYEHQLLITSNCSLPVLLNKWIARDTEGAADAENYANKIGRRIKEMCIEVDFS